MTLTFAKDANGHSPLYYIAVTISSPSSSSNFQQLIGINSNTNSAYYGSTLSNVNWQDGAGNILDSWLEGDLDSGSQTGESNTSTTSRYWVKIPTGSTTTVYQVLYGTSQNSMDGTVTGAEPKYTGTYAQYDNGANVFNNYWNFAGSSGLPAGWTNVGITYSQNNGLTATATAANGYMYYSTSTISSPIVADYYGKVYESTAYFTGVGLTYIPIANNFGYEGYTIATGYGGSYGTIGDYYGFQSNGAGTASLEGPSASGLTSNMMLSLSYISASSASYALNYATLGTSTSPTVGTPVYLSLFMSGAYATSYTYPNTAYIQYVRTRAYPPNGAMPSTSQGALTSLATHYSVSASGGSAGSATYLASSKYSASGASHGAATYLASSKYLASGGSHGTATLRFPTQVINVSASSSGSAKYVTASFAYGSGASKGSAAFTANSAYRAEGSASGSASYKASSVAFGEGVSHGSAAFRAASVAFGSGSSAGSAAYIASSVAHGTGTSTATATLRASSVCYAFGSSKGAAGVSIVFLVQPFHTYYVNAYT